MGLVDRFETDQKVLTAGAAGEATPAGPATALARPGTSQTELMRVFYVVFYPYRADSPLTKNLPSSAGACSCKAASEIERQRGRTRAGWHAL